jgi:hypothetical protein
MQQPQDAHLRPLWPIGGFNRPIQRSLVCLTRVSYRKRGRLIVLAIRLDVGLRFCGATCSGEGWGGGAADFTDILLWMRVRCE